MDESRLAEFVAFAQGLKGDETSEERTFLTRLFQAFGHGVPLRPEASARVRAFAKGMPPA